MKIWLQVTAGRGPAACCWVAARTAEAIVAEASRSGLSAREIDREPGPEAGTARSALLSLEGDPAGLDVFVAGWAGTVQWVGTSPYRPHHKRRNWFVGVGALRPPETPVWSPRDLKYEAMRSGGPGGQHADRRDTAVRVTHLPTGISVAAREERSQRANRKLAEARLAAALADRGRGAQADARQERWRQHDALERGNPTRVYRGRDFRRK